MAQVICLNPLSAGLPTEAVANLNKAETVLLRALGAWVAAYRLGKAPRPQLCEAMGRTGAHDVAFSVDQLMAVVARSVRQPIAIHCPHCPHVPDDERRLLYAAGMVQLGDSRLAQRALRTALLSAAGAELIIGPLEGWLNCSARLGCFARRLTSAPCRRPMMSPGFSRHHR